MKFIAIEDFSGGKNLLDSQLRIADNQCPTAENVWTPQGALTKVPGWTIYSTHTATAFNIPWLYADENINTTYQFYMRVQSGASGTLSSVSTAMYPWGASDALGDGPTPLGYTTGSVSISGASLISATGNGTSWATHASGNDFFRINTTASGWFKVASVEDDTHLTLSAAIPVAVATGSAYTIMPAMEEYEMSAASLNGSWWACSTGFIMQRYDSTGMTRIPAAPKAAFLQVYQNYMFAARTNTAESRLYWSAIKDPTTWPSNNFIDIDKDKGKITGIHAYGNELIIFKSRNLYKVIGSTFDPSNPTYAVYEIGVPRDFIFNNHRTSAVHNGILHFYAPRKIYAYIHGTFFIKEISNKYYIDLPNISSRVFNLSDTPNDQLMSAVSFREYYIIKGIRYDTTAEVFGGIIGPNNAWWYLRDTINTTSSPLGRSPMIVLSPNINNPGRILTTFDLSLTGPYVLAWNFIPAYATQYINRIGGANAAIAALWRSKEFNIEYGTFKHIVIYFAKQSAGTFTFSWSIDQGTFVDNTVDMTVGRGQLIRATLNINQKGSTIQLRITQATASQTFQVYAIKIFYEPYTEDRKL